MSSSANPKATQPSRREFLKTAAVAATFTIVPRHVLGGPGYTAPSSVVTRAVIGTGGMGLGAHVTANGDNSPPRTLAVCDVDANHLRRALAKAGRGCEGYRDWRQVLERTDIDTIHIATPPHWHGVMGIAAAQAGFDILAEKPFTRTIGEGRRYADTVDVFGRMLQINTYFRFGNYYSYGPTQRLRKLVQSGRLGSPLRVVMGPEQGFDWKVAMWSGRRDLVPQQVPSELDYDLWLGPAPKKPYHPHRVHGSFRGYWDYDGGGLADMGQHYLDPIQYILGKDDTGPVEISAEAPWPAHPDAVGLWRSVTLRYADGDELQLYSGEWGEAQPKGEPLLAGPNGKVFPRSRTKPEGLLEGLDAEVPDPPPLIDFETSVRERRKAGGSEASSHRSCSLVNLANIAIRTGRKLRFDPEAERFIDDPVADRLLDFVPRAPWGLPTGRTK